MFFFFVIWLKNRNLTTTAPIHMHNFKLYMKISCSHSQATPIAVAFISLALGICAVFIRGNTVHAHMAIYLFTPTNSEPSLLQTYVGKTNSIFTDIDECENSNPCSQICVNTDGSYYCQCVSKYTLNQDRHTCTQFGQSSMVVISPNVHACS